VALFVALLMVGSIFALIQYQDQYKPPPQNPPKNQKPTTLKYSASNVQSKVLDIFPRIRFGAKTSESEVSSIDKAILSTGKVLKIENSQFSGQNGEYYVADFRLQSTSQIEELMEAIKQIPFIEDPEFMKYSIVRVPDKIELKNETLGITQEYQFKGSQVQALVNPETRKGDLIEISLNTEFAGQQLISSYAVETSNVDAREQIFSLVQKSAISRLENEYLINSESSPKKMNELEKAKLELAKLDENSNLKVYPQSLNFTIFFSEPEKISANDLNFYLSGHQSISSFTLQLDSNKAIVTAKDENISQFAEKLKEGLEAFGFKISSIQEPKVFLEGTISNTDNEKILKTINSTEKNHGLKFIVFRKAKIDANSIYVPDANYEFMIPEGYFNAYVKPTHKNGDEIEMNTLVIASKRKGIRLIQAQEIIKQN
jgi:hypothetical protein